jgi:hypothetical protein
MIQGKKGARPLLPRELFLFCVRHRTVLRGYPMDNARVCIERRAGVLAAVDAIFCVAEMEC